MKMKSISLAAQALAGTAALEQGNAAGGSSLAGEPASNAIRGYDMNNSTTTGGAAMKNDVTGTTTGSPGLR